MTNPQPRFQGIWLPLVSPFQDGKLDETALRRLVRTYASRVDGLVLGATTGEGLALGADELRLIVRCAAEELETANAPARILVGLAGAATSAAIDALIEVETEAVDGYLVACPHYVRPSQAGLRLHFYAIASSTDKDLLVYNIPYRTGVNLQNDTLLRLAERRNIVGVKDCCGDPRQTRDLIARKPAGLSVLTGEDAGLCQSLRAGADGGVVASAHLDPEGFRRLWALAAQERWAEADALWSLLAPIPDLLFAEPNPAPLKYCLWRMGLIQSPELRLPMTPVSSPLSLQLDRVLESDAGASRAHAGAG